MTAPDPRAAVIERLADLHRGHGDYPYLLATDDLLDLPPHERDEFISALDLRDAVQAELDGAPGDVCSFEIGGVA